MGSLANAETLTELLKRKVLSVSTEAGTKPGDNYLSTMQAFDVVVENNDGGDDEEEVMHLVAKIYPANDVRRDYNNQVNIFYKEWAAYQHLIPKLKEFSNAHGLNRIFRNMFAPFHAGRATDFSLFDEKDLEDYSLKPFNELDQFILLTDVRKTGNYKMVSRQESLDVDHFALLMVAIAKIHALSWSYKVKKGIEFSSEFPFLNFGGRPTVKKVWSEMLETALEMALDVFDTHLGKDSKISEGTRKQREMMSEVVNTYFTSDENADAVNTRLQSFDKLLRIPPETVENEELWTVVVHGDCWVNNFLFAYDKATQKPKDVIMVDLQFTRYSCPTADLCYLLYTSTDAEFRAAHMESMLRLYSQKFIKYCGLFGVEPLPGFSFDELMRRVHRGKLYGYLLAILLLPAFLKDAEEADDLDNVQDIKIQTMFSSAGQNDSKYVKRMLEIGKEMYAEGII